MIRPEGQHLEGRVEFIEGMQVRAACECGWSTRKDIPFKTEASKRATHEQVHYRLVAHQKAHNENPDEGVTL